MKRTLLSLSLLTALVLSALPTNIARADGPIPVEDQSFITPTNTATTFAAVPFSYVAQTFTAGFTGLLSGVSIDATTAPLTGEIKIEIRSVTNGVPTGTVLGERLLMEDELQTMNAAPLSYIVPLPNIFIRAGTEYAIVAYYTQYSNLGIPQTVWSGATGNYYAGGSVFTAAGDTPSNWVPAANGLDLHFRTFVITGMPVSDLSIQWVSGAKKAPACKVFRETYRISNFGPDPATRVQVGIGGGDQFGFVSVDGVPAEQTEYFDLAVGESRLIVAYFKVVAFVPGESRDGFISAGISSDIYPDIAIDPNPGNNNAGTSVWLVGQPRVSCPR